jgi:hypothetical protein
MLPAPQMSKGLLLIRMTSCGCCILWSDFSRWL